MVRNSHSREIPNNFMFGDHTAGRNDATKDDFAVGMNTTLWRNSNRSQTMKQLVSPEIEVITIIEPQGSLKEVINKTKPHAMI